MPLNSVTPDRENNAMAGVLYVVATPIGNLEDITLRALKVLGSVDGIAAEDTRHTRTLLSHHGIHTRLIAYHEHNEQTKSVTLIRQIAAGASIALVTDAGTPAVSDPGFRLVKAAIESGIRVIPIPGASAAITALSVGGLPTDSFIFVGFAAKKKGKRFQQFQALAGEPRTLIFYESPRRISELLAELEEILGNRNAVLGREMTKHYEEFIRGSLSEIRNRLEERTAIKGECTLLVAGKEESDVSAASSDSLELSEKVATALAHGVSPSDISRQLSTSLGVPRKLVYDIALTLKKEKEKQ